MAISGVIWAELWQLSRIFHDHTRPFPQNVFTTPENLHNIINITKRADTGTAIISRYDFSKVLFRGHLDTNFGRLRQFFTRSLDRGDEVRRALPKILSQMST